jgi:sugar (pentulose or hexulose) kinase
MNRYFSVDLGADSGRCIAGTLENGKLVMEELHRFPTRYVLLGGSLRWNIYRFYEEILAGLRKYAATYGKELYSIGVLRDDIADSTCVNRGVRIIAPAVHDTASAALAIPAKGDDFAYISSGTWSIFGTELDEPVLDRTASDLNISNSGGALGKSLFLKNVMGLWILQQSKRCWNKAKPDLGYDTIMAMAEKAPPFFAFIDPDAPDFFNPR